jgi:uncharacterized protein YcnI
MMLRLIATAGAVALAAAASSASVSAHTEPDYVAVPAGAEAVVNLKPTHGCGDSPTVNVRVRAPLPAQPGEVEGWTVSSTPSEDGRTILEWTGGLLPADEEGAFPVRFLVPDTPGDLLTFPAVQRCENGERLSWLSGDPEHEYPAPRVLILPAGFEPALTIDDVPPDVPGREKLTAIVDVDRPNTPPTAPSTTTPPTTLAVTSLAPSTTTTPTSPATIAETTVASTTTASSAPVATTAPVSPSTSLVAPVVGDDSDSSSVLPAIIVAGAVAAAAAGAVALVIRARRRPADAP